MGRSVSTPSAARVVAYAHFDIGAEDDCPECDGTGTVMEAVATSGEAIDADQEEVDCDYCGGSGQVASDADFDWECILDDYRTHLKNLFPSVERADQWIGREDYVVAENKLARFGISEYCGLVAYWIVPAELGWEHDYAVHHLSDRWIDSIADRFTKTFGTLTKTGTASNGESFYTRSN